MPGQKLISSVTIPNYDSIMVSTEKYGRKIVDNLGNICVDPLLRDRSHFSLISLNREYIFVYDREATPVMSVEACKAVVDCYVTTIVDGTTVERDNETREYRKAPLFLTIKDGNIIFSGIKNLDVVYDHINDTEYKSGVFPALVSWLIGLGVMAEDITVQDQTGW